MNWKGTRVAVTGAGGFIGSHLTEELARQGAKVRAMVRYNGAGSRGFLEEAPAALRRRIEVRAGDVRDPHFVEDFCAGQEVVFHLAALIAIPYSYEAPSSYAQTNVQGTLNVLQACRRGRVGRLVHTSTSEVYGTALYTPIDEKHPLQPQSPYSASKIGADALAESFYRSFGLPVTIARPFNTFGPRQSARAVIPTIAAQLLSGAAELRIGALEPVRDFNHVADTVDGFLALAASKRCLGETVNLGSGRGVTIGRTADMLMRLAGRRAKIRVEKARLRPERSEVYKLICGNAKAKRLAGWRPRRTLEQGLSDVLAYVAAHAERYKPGLYNV
ncbi:MAG: SDR family NAD(P)-dependent oxidoreductase [Elusimicrobiota bacterium]|nr:SDR family NAD(P)-dependent oxidoreductase [Elusimicrobiota bacterium]